MQDNNTICKIHNNVSTAHVASSKANPHLLHTWHHQTPTPTCCSSQALYKASKASPPPPPRFTHFSALSPLSTHRVFEVCISGSHRDTHLVRCHASNSICHIATCSRSRFHHLGVDSVDGQERACRCRVGPDRRAYVWVKVCVREREKERGDTQGTMQRSSALGASFLGWGRVSTTNHAKREAL